MLKDLIVAWRTLIKKPGYAVAVITTLGIGIGASAMTFSLLDAALMRPLPFERADRLVALIGVAGPERSPRGASFPEVLDWRARTAALDDVVVFDDSSVNLRVGTESLRVRAELVSARYFPLLGVRAALGRTFLPEEDAVPDRDTVAVISYTFWRERLGGDPNVISRVLYLNDRPLQVVGVMPEGFLGLSFNTDVWVPSMLVDLINGPGMSTNRGARWLVAYARLKDGATLEQAQDDLTRVARELEAEFPATNRERGVDVRLLRDSMLGGGRRLVVALFAAVALLLLVACTNVASLQLARAMARRQELAVRIALGAGRWHVIRQLLAESILLSAAAGAAGALAAAWALGVALTLTPDGALPAYVRPAVDVRVLLFAIGVSTVVAIAMPLLPALAAWRHHPSDALKAGARTVEPGLGSIRRPSVQQALVVGEIALATVLLASAALMARSLQRQMDVRLGFEPAGVTVARVSMPGGRDAAAARISFVSRLREHLTRMPDVAAVGVGSDIPLTGRASAATILPDSAQPTEPRARYYRHLVAPGYFATLGIRITRGREFTDADRAGAPLVAVINESGARRFWGAADPIGRHLVTNDPANPRIEIVGVVADARFRDLRTDIAAARAEPDIFFPYGQRTDSDVEFAVRTHSGEPVSAAALQAVIGRLDSALPVYQTQPLARAVALQTSTARFASALMGTFSLVALLLAALGLYGLLAYVIGLSRRDIAIRLALGANGWMVGGLIVRNSLVLVLVGAAIGGAAAIAAGRAMGSLLFQTSSRDPVTLGTVSLLLLTVTAAATIVPARRAVRVEPHVALKD